MATIKTILCPVDLSERSIAAISFAATLARDYDATLILLYVQEPPLEFGELTPNFPKISNCLEALREIPLDPRIKVERRVEDGLPAEMILRIADETSSDLIVMSTHGRRGVRRWILGSVTETIMRSAKCPVVTVSQSRLDTVEPVRPKAETT